MYVLCFIAIVEERVNKELWLSQHLFDMVPFLGYEVIKGSRSMYYLISKC